MAELCKNCFHCSVCGSSKKENVSNLIDTAGCMQFTPKDRVIVLPSPIKPGTKVDVDLRSQRVPYFVDKIVIYRNGGIDIYSRSENSQGTFIFGPEDIGNKVFFHKKD